MIKLHKRLKSELKWKSIDKASMFDDIVSDLDNIFVRSVIEELESQPTEILFEDAILSMLEKDKIVFSNTAYYKYIRVE
jgi:hypothetical protein